MPAKSKFVWIFGCLIAFFLIIVPFVLSRFWVGTITEILILTLAGISLNFLLGYAGCLSFGHGAFFATAAYTTAILITRTGLNQYFVILLVAPLMAAFLGAIIGILISRLYAFYYAIMTVAFTMILWSIIRRLRDLTGGDSGILGVHFAGFLQEMNNIYFFTLAVVVLCAIILWIIGNSPFGWALRAIRENPVRSSFVSINVVWHRYLALVVSSFFCGMAGSLHVVYTFGAFPELAFWTKSADIVTICILGGINSFLGPAIGSAVLILLETFITSVTLYWPLILGIIICAVVLLMPQGITGLIRNVFNKGRGEFRA
ncbi:MAG: branched-chain amino acid ABC transporter permease [Syntrophales bacterium]|jgi:branched-chain amino acid transport system permease protein|nr:branched-chain amino acid ABC transporter permease [Syntrophales bacterium]MDY0044122.1 branched-chain amino acid ABC transporter permease [Syntrophales bacterium]